MTTPPDLGAQLRASVKLVTTQRRRNSYAVSQEAITKAAFVHCRLEGSETLTVEQIVKMQKAATEAQAIWCEIQGDLSAMKAEMILTKADSETVTDAAVETILNGDGGPINDKQRAELERQASGDFEGGEAEPSGARWSGVGCTIHISDCACGHCLPTPEAPAVVLGQGTSRTEWPPREQIGEVLPS